MINKCFIFVVGEIGYGKSLFINFVLEKNECKVGYIWCVD